jgi:hypothetical protein
MGDVNDADAIADESARWKCKCFYAKRGKRLCKTCDHPYTMSTGGTALRIHMWGKYPPVASRNNVPLLPSQSSSSSNSRSLSFSASASAAPIVVEGEEYVTMHHITSGYRWNIDKENALQEALVSEGIGTLMSNVKVKIRKYTGDTNVA